MSKEETIRQFNKVWHQSINGTWHKMRWLGVKVIKTPTDLWMYQELIHRTKPDYIIETGTCFGGSALYLATVCEALNYGRVITVDVRKPRHPPQHDRLEYYTGGSTEFKTIDYLRNKIEGEVMVILDSDHHKDHVLKELKLYSPFVARGGYLVVEDTNLNGDVRKDFGPGPREAVAEFLQTNNRFEIDEDCEKYYLTFCPGGYLKCVR